MKNIFFCFIIVGVLGCGNETPRPDSQEPNFVELYDQEWIALEDGAYRARNSFPSLDSDHHFEVHWKNQSATDELQIFLFADQNLENGLRLNVRRDSLRLYSDRADVSLDLSAFADFLSSDELRFSFDLHHSHAHLLIWNEKSQILFDSGVFQIALPPRGLGRHWGFKNSGGELLHLAIQEAKLDH